MSRRLTRTEIIFARMELARRRKKGVRLSLHDLERLNISHLGELMSECADLAIQPAGLSALADPSGGGKP